MLGCRYTDSLLCLICFGIFVIFIKYHWSRRKLYLFSLKSHGPIALPILGSVFSFIGSKEHMADVLKRLYDMRKSPTVLWFGGTLHYVAKTSEEISIILNSSKTIQKASLYKSFELLTGQGLFNVNDVNIWRLHRKALAPAFNQTTLNSYSNIFQNHATLLVDKFKKYIGRGEIDISDEMIAYTIGLVNETAMSFEYNTLSIQEEFLKNFKKLLSKFEKMILLWQIQFPFWLSVYWLGSSTLFDRIRTYCSQIISFKRNNTNYENNVDRFVKRKSFIEMLLELTDKEKKFSEKECIDEVLTFTLAGSDTCAFTIGTVLLMLAMHPQLQEEIFEEVISICSEKSDPITRDDICHFSRLERFIKETMRLFPVALSVARHCAEDLDIGSVVLPKGIDILICIYGHHRNPKIWPDPLIFNPDRFLPEETKKRHPYAYIPFLAGPRNCIGYRYAMMLLLMTTATLVREFKFKTHLKRISDIKLGLQVKTTVDTGFPIEILRRIA